MGNKQYILEFYSSADELVSEPPMDGDRIINRCSETFDWFMGGVASSVWDIEDKEDVTQIHYEFAKTYGFVKSDDGSFSITREQMKKVLLASQNNAKQLMQNAINDFKRKSDHYKCFDKDPAVEIYNEITGRNGVFLFNSWEMYSVLDWFRLWLQHSSNNVLTLWLGNVVEYRAAKLYLE